MAHPARFRYFASALAGFGIALSWVCTASNACALQEADKPEPRRFSYSEYYSATQVPDRIALTVSGDPSTQMSVTWRTAKLDRSPYAEIVPATAGPEFLAKTKTKVEATSQKLEFRLQDSYYHSATFTKLKPNTQYLYRVGDGKHFSEWSEFSTAKQNDDTFSFVYFGDAQNAIKAMWSRVARRGLRDMPDAAFFLHAGDLVNVANSDTEWGEWFYAAGWIHRSIPIVATPGNHEYDRRGLSRHWQTNFELPKNGPAGELKQALSETCYTFVYQGTRFVSVDSNQNLEVQAKWLDKVLDGNTANWTIFTCHHPFYSPAARRDNPKLREIFAPVFKKHRIDLCLQGHDHSYARTYQTELTKDPQEAGGSRHQKNGTVFAVSVSGPKMYSATKLPLMQRVAEGTQLYQLVTVEKNRIEYKALTATGQLYDHFELKRDGENVELVDKTPSSKERWNKDIYKDK